MGTLAAERTFIASPGEAREETGGHLRASGVVHADEQLAGGDGREVRSLRQEGQEADGGQAGTGVVNSRNKFWTLVSRSSRMERTVSRV